MRQAAADKKMTTEKIQRCAPRRYCLRMTMPYPLCRPPDASSLTAGANYRTNP